MNETISHQGLKEQINLPLPSLSIIEGLEHLRTSVNKYGGDRAFWLNQTPSTNEIWQFRAELPQEVSVLNDSKNVLVVLGTKVSIVEKAMPSEGEFAGLDRFSGLNSRLHFHLDRHQDIPTFGDVVHASRYPLPDASYVWTRIGIFRYKIPKDFFRNDWRKEYSDFWDKRPFDYWSEHETLSDEDKTKMSYWQSKGADIQFFAKGSKSLESLVPKIF